MLMTNVESDRPASAQGIQWGIARISIVASTGSPSTPSVEQRLQGAHRVVVPHVLVDLEHDAGRVAGVDQRRGLGDTTSPAASAPGCPRTRRGWASTRSIMPGCSRGRYGDVDDLDRGVVEHLLERCDRPWARPRSAATSRAVSIDPRGDPHDAEAGLGVGDQVAVADDEARADDADPDVAALGRQREDGSSCRRRSSASQADSTRSHRASCPASLDHRQRVASEQLPGNVEYRGVLALSRGRRSGGVAARPSASSSGWNQRANSASTVPRATDASGRGRLPATGPAPP